MQIISLVIIFLIVIVLLIDIIPIFGDWFNRIHIGRYNNKILWSNSIVHTAKKWLLKMPKVKVTDNTRFVILDILRGNYTKKAIQHWQEAAILLGIAEYLRLNNDHKVKQGILNYLNNKFEKNGQWKEKPKHIDAAILAYALMKLNFIDINEYKNALDYVWELIKDHIGDEGTAGYRKSMMDYRYVDTIGFICPFLIAYGTKFNADECIELAVKQIQDYEQYGMLNHHNIPCHAYKIENKIPQGLFGWGRGFGWFAIGLIDSWNELPIDNKYKSILEESVKRLANAAIKFQQENGSWNWAITRGETRADSSATATLGWFLLNASFIEEISKDCLNSAERAINYLMKVTRRTGAVDFSQGDTKDIGVYSMLFTILPFTQGFSIRLISLYRRRYMK